MLSICPSLGSSMILTWEGMYCPSSVELCHVSSGPSYMILTWEGTYFPSTGELYDFDLRRHVLSIICPCWPAICPSSGSSMILTWEATYCPSSSWKAVLSIMILILMRRHVLPINWGALRFWPEKARTVHHLGSSIILTWEGTYCPSSGELYDFDRRGHVLSIIWGAIWFWPETNRTVQGSMMLSWEGHPLSGELCDFDMRRHVLSIIWGALWFDMRRHVLSIICGAI